MSPLPPDLADLNAVEDRLESLLTGTWSPKIREQLSDPLNPNEGYWNKKIDTTEGFSTRAAKLEHYIKEILPKELAIVKVRQHLEQTQNLSQKTEKRLPEKPTNCDLLILLVGFSIEPLLQSICVWEPQKVILLYNKGKYGNTPGKQFVTTIKKSIELLFSDDMPDTTDLFETPIKKNFAKMRQMEIEPCQLDGDEPKDVFQKALEVVRKKTTNNTISKTNIVIDITGGKKKMVSGAYLFASFTNITVSYVDFDDNAYQEESGKPFGDAFKIGVLKNPYESFSLHSWKAVEELYEKQLYGRAREEVDKLIPKMKGVFGETHQYIQAAGQLRDLLEIYELWIRADYHNAKADIDALTIAFESPLLFNDLSIYPKYSDYPNPPNNANQEQYDKYKETYFDAIRTSFEKFALGAGNFTNSFYQSDSLVDYVVSEKIRIDILLKNGEYRSTFIRAYGVTEVLLKTLLIGYLVKDKIDIDINDSGNPVVFSKIMNSKKEKLCQAVYRCSKTEEILEMLYGIKSLKLNMPIKASLTIQTTPYILSINNLLQQNNANKQQMESFILTQGRLKEIRHQAVHFCFWIPKDLAVYCFKYMETIITLFEKRVVEDKGNIALLWDKSKTNYFYSWKDICHLSGIEFLLH